MVNENDYYKRIVNELYNFILRSGGEVSFEELAEWAERNSVGSITLSIALNDLIDSGKITAPKGFFEPEDYIVAFPVPRIIRIVDDKALEEGEHEEARSEGKKIEAGVKREYVKEGESSSTGEVVQARTEVGVFDANDFNRAIEYLNDYWSVGVIRFIHDLKSMGISNPDLILKKLIELEYVNYLPIGVINATSKLPRIKRSKKLSEFI